MASPFIYDTVYSATSTIIHVYHDRYINCVFELVQTCQSFIDTKATLNEGGLQEYNKVASTFYMRDLEEQGDEESGRMSKREVRAKGIKEDFPEDSKARKPASLGTCRMSLYT